MAQFNIQKLMKQAQEAQAKMEAAQQELAATTVDASAGGGMVKVTMRGDNQLQSITIDPQAAGTDDITMLEDMILAAVNEAARSVAELASSKMDSVTGGIDIPNIPGLM
ncbi:MAG: YbaB/EbfC family nucleoid-associated protein [Actinomycetia bacterium]|nr:YbaB/EbfC family nucleoid-associated protein [Actinomycetes bacterium]